jgi:hypothetical protein
MTCGESKTEKREIKHRACKYVGKYSSEGIELGVGAAEWSESDGGGVVWDGI